MLQSHWDGAKQTQNQSYCLGPGISESRNLWKRLNPKKNPMQEREGELDVVAYIFNPSTQEAELDICEFGARLVYIASSKTFRGTLRDPTSKQKRK